MDEDDDQPVRKKNRCPYCRSTARPEVRTRVGQVGWAVVILCLVTVCLAPFCWLGLFIKESILVCPDCGARLDAVGPDNSNLGRAARRNRLGF